MHLIGQILLHMFCILTQLSLKHIDCSFLQGDKDKKIEELTQELERQDQLCAAYREKLLSFINNVEEQTEELSSNIQVIVDNIRKVESEGLKLSHHR